MSWQTAVSQIERTYSSKGRAQTGLYSIEGVRLNERALRAGQGMQTAVISQTFQDSPSERQAKLLAAFAALSVPTVVIPNEEMARLTNGRSLGDIISLLPIPQPPSLSEILREWERPLLLTAVDIVDPGNIGAMIRTAHGLGCAAFVTVGSADPFHPKAARTSMGSLFKLPTVSYGNVDALLVDFARLGILSVGTAVSAPSSLPNLLLPSAPVSVIMGSEYFGLPENIIQKLDYTVSIPMADGIDSLSVNAATAIMLYAIGHQQAASAK